MEEAVASVAELSSVCCSCDVTLEQRAEALDRKTSWDLGSFPVCVRNGDMAEKVCWDSFGGVVG